MATFPNDEEDFPEETKQFFLELKQLTTSPPLSEEFHERLTERLKRVSSTLEESAHEDEIQISPVAPTKVTPLPHISNGNLGRKAMPTWLQQWTPAVTMAALLVLAFAFWTNGPFAPEWTRRPSETESSGTRGSVSRQESDKTLYALIQQGERAREAGNTDQAVEAYRQAVNQVAIPLNQLAWLAYERGKGTNNPDEMTKGLAWARLAVQLQPNEPEYLDTLAVILCTVGEREEAIRTMEKAVQMEKDKQLQKEKSDKLAGFRQGACQ